MGRGGAIKWSAVARGWGELQQNWIELSDLGRSRRMMGAKDRDAQKFLFAIHATAFSARQFVNELPLITTVACARLPCPLLMPEDPPDMHPPLR